VHPVTTQSAVHGKCILKLCSCPRWASESPCANSQSLCSLLLARGHLHQQSTPASPEVPCLAFLRLPSFPALRCMCGECCMTNPAPQSWASRRGVLATERRTDRIAHSNGVGGARHFERGGRTGAGTTVGGTRRRRGTVHICAASAPGDWHRL